MRDGSTRDRLAALDNPLLPRPRVDLEDGLDPVELGLLAAALDPELEAERKRRAEAEAGVPIARRLPNPELAVTAADPYGSGSEGLRTALDTALSFGTRSLLTRGARVDAARFRARQVALGGMWREWEVAQKTRLAAVQLDWIRTRRALAEEELELVLGTMRSLERAIASGNATVLELEAQRSSAEAIRKTLVELAQGEARKAAEISARLGTDEWSRYALAAGHRGPGAVRPADAGTPLGACLARRLDLAALRAGYAAQEADLRGAVLAQFPDLRIGLVSIRDEASLKLLGGAVSLGVPLFDRNRARIQAARATRERLAAEYRTRALSVKTAVEGALDMLRTIDARLPELRRSVEAMRRLEAVQREAAARGDLDRLSRQRARLALLDLRLLVAALAGAREEAEIALETACGVELGGGRVEATSP